MSKATDLEGFSIGALRRIVEWLELQGRLMREDELRGRSAHVECLAAKLSREEVDGLLRCYQSNQPYFRDDDLATVLGFPQKAQVLSTCTKEVLQQAMSQLERAGTVGIFWKSLSASDLREYLSNKFNNEQVAALMWGIRARSPSTPQPRETAAVRERSSSRGSSRAAPTNKPARARQSEAAGGAQDVGRILFGKYEILARLRAGGMAEVFKAREIASKELRFIKRVQIGTRDEKSLHREQQIYSKLEYADIDGVMRVHAVERDDEYMALVCDFADGGSLGMYLRDKGQLAHAEVRDIGLEIATALKSLHDLGIVHRDLKPDNVMFHQRRWRLTDFGIGKNIQALATTTFQRAGTRAYAAPEQAEGVEARPSADIYSFGKLLTELLTGQTDPDHLQVGDWRQLVRRCVERDPSLRLRSADLVLEIKRLPT